MRLAQGPGAPARRPPECCTRLLQIKAKVDSVMAAAKEGAPLLRVDGTLE